MEQFLFHLVFKSFDISCDCFQVYESGIKELEELKDQLEADNGDGVDESTALQGGSQVI
jgi:hypothetical protein